MNWTPWQEEIHVCAFWAEADQMDAMKKPVPVWLAGVENTQVAQSDVPVWLAELETDTIGKSVLIHNKLSIVWYSSFDL